MNSRLKFGLQSARLSAVLAVVAGACFAPAQSQAWEKLVAPGLTYRMEIDLGLPRVIHALRYTPGVDTVTARPELAKNRIMITEDVNKGRDTLTNTIKNKGAIAGVNGDFFPWTGDPLGAMVRGGELLSTPSNMGRSSFAWGSGYYYVGPVDMAITVSQGDVKIPVTAVNQELEDNQIVVSTAAQGVSTSKVTAVHAIVETDQVLTPGKSITGTIKIFSPDNTNQKVEDGQIVISATGNKKALLTKLQRGQEVSIAVDSKTVNWDRATHAISGGPMLVRDGKVTDSTVSERFEASFATTRHPRTAVGVTQDGDVWLVVVDGRQPMSRGSSLAELAQLMIRLGCVQAVNLDGGGSSTMSIGGQTMNRPSGGVERAISNSFLLFGTLPIDNAGTKYVIKGVPRMKQGESATYAVISESGEVVPAKDVFWSAQGAAWIDQSGVLRAHASGNAKVSARIKGVLVTVDIAVDPAQKPPSPGVKS